MILRFTIILALLQLCLAPSTVNAQVAKIRLPITLHLLVIADTHDQTIGSAAQKSLDQIESYFDRVGEVLPAAYKKTIFKGADLRTIDFEKRFTSINIKKNDAVFFFYIGHGIENVDGLQFPTIGVKQSVNFGELASVLVDKKPRLLIAVSDACNSETSFENSEIPILAEITNPDINSYPTPELVNAYSRLFIESVGIVILSSAMRGERAYYDPEIGGFYTNLFVRSLSEASRHYRARWSLIFEPMFNQLHYTSLLGEDEISQHPHFITFLKDLVNIHSRISTYRTDSIKNDGCWDDLNPGNPNFPKCLALHYGLSSNEFHDRAMTLKEADLVYIDETALDIVSRYSVKKENASYEMIALAQRYHYGDGAIDENFDKSYNLVKEAYDMGNPEAAGILGDRNFYQLQQTNDVNFLTRALSWYNKGWNEFADVRAHIEWAKWNAWYGRNPEKIRQSIPILLKYNDTEPSIKQFLDDLCQRHFSKACI